MAEVNLTINGRTYGIACDDGQEQRVIDLGQYIDSRVKEIARAGAASNENHLLVLTSIVLADEVADLREAIASGASGAVQDGGTAGNGGQSSQDDRALVSGIDQLAARIDSIAASIQNL